MNSVKLFLSLGAVVTANALQIASQAMSHDYTPRNVIGLTISSSAGNGSDIYVRSSEGEFASEPRHARPTMLQRAGG